MALIQGMRIVIVPPPMRIERTWRQRLLSRPWRPWRKYRMSEHPMWGVLQGREVWVHGGVVYMRQDQFEAMKPEMTPLHAPFGAVQPVASAPTTPPPLKPKR